MVPLRPIRSQPWPQNSSRKTALRFSSLSSIKMPSHDGLEFCQSTRVVTSIIRVNPSLGNYLGIYSHPMGFHHIVIWLNSTLAVIIVVNIIFPTICNRHPPLLCLSDIEQPYTGEI